MTYYFKYITFLITEITIWQQVKTFNHASFLAIIEKKTNNEDLRITALTKQQPPGVHYETCRVGILGRLTPCFVFSHVSSPGNAPEKSQRHSVSFMSLWATEMVNGHYLNQELLFHRLYEAFQPSLGPKQCWYFFQIFFSFVITQWELN